MPTSDLRRFLPSARLAGMSLVASGLVLGLTMTTAGATPAWTTPSLHTDSVDGTATESLDPAFVQEGMPSAQSGQLVGWGDQGGGSTTRALPDGVHATAVSSDRYSLLLLRSDGRVDLHEYDIAPVDADPLPAPPDGTHYTAVSAGTPGTGRILRSDGVVVSLSGRVIMTPPDNLAYTAISGELALRSDGVLSDAGDPNVSCADVRDPGSGPRYTAVSARSGRGNWAALRSDGALVYCRDGFEGSTVTVVDPPAGTRFVGVDMGVSEAIGATADGRVISTNGSQLAAAPAGRSIVSLAAMDFGEGAAALDDGTIISWGLYSRDSAPPVVPAGRDVFSAVSGYSSYGQHWAIVVGDPIPVEVSVDVSVPTKVSGPAERPTRVTDRVALNVSAALAGGTPVPGRVTTTVTAPDGKTRTLEPERTDEGNAEVEIYPWHHELAGSYGLSTAFSGSPYATSSVETALDLKGASPVVLTTSGPTTWHRGTENSLCFTLATADGSPLWWTRDGQATIRLEGDPGLVYHVAQPSSGAVPAKSCVHYLAPQPGTYTARFDYEGWGTADSASWTGQVVVLPTARTQVESDLPTTWRYGQMPDFFSAEVTSEGPVPLGRIHLRLDGRQFGSGEVLDATGRGRLWIGDEEELVPGSYLMLVRYQGGRGFVASELERMVFVQPAVFTTKTASISGTPEVGRTLTAVPGTWSPTATSYRYTWKVDGAVVTSATSNTFTVPASAAGKTIKVLITGLRQYHESLAASAPVTIAPGTFTSPRPTVKGTVKVGRTLTVSPGTWSPAPSSLKYVWKANGTTVSTRSTNTLVVPASAKGKRLTVTVTGSRSGYTPRSVASTATSVVAPATFKAPRPAIKGTKRVGSTLTVVRGSWSPTPSAVKYVWKANGVTISTRTSSKFVVPAKARGKQLTVTVTGTKAGYTTKSVTSYRTTTIR